MIDFNTKKRILKKLSDCAHKNFLMLIPCLIAAGAVRLFYFAACSIDIALSDKEGNFLGIRSSEKEKPRRVKKQDDIVYVKRPFFSRLVSCVLAFAFAGMFIPVAMPAMTAAAIQSTKATAPSAYVLTKDFGSGDKIEFGRNNTSEKYYIDTSVTFPIDRNQTDPNVYDNVPKLDLGAGKIKAGSTSFQLWWDYNLTSTRWKLTSYRDGNGNPIDPNETISKFVACYDECDKATGNVLRTYSEDIRIENVDQLASSKGTEATLSHTFTGLRPDLYNYKFYVKIYERVQAYKIPSDDALEYYMYTSTNSAGTDIYNIQTDFLRDDRGAYVYITDPATGKLVQKFRKNLAGDDITKNAKLETSSDLCYVISSDKVNGEDYNLGRQAPEVNFKAAYDRTSNSVVLSNVTSTASTISGYIIYRSDEIPGTNGGMTPYKIVTVQENMSSPYYDRTVDRTMQYDYVICTYEDIYHKGAYTEENKEYYITSPRPSGTQSNSPKQTVFTETAKPAGKVNVTNMNSYFLVSWYNVPNASYYKLTRSLADDTGNPVAGSEVDLPGASEIEPMAGDKTSYKDETAKKGERYVYTVTTVNRRNQQTPNDGNRVSVLNSEATSSLNPKVDQPSIVDITSSPNDATATITWECPGSSPTGFDFKVEEIVTDNNGNPVDINGNPTTNPKNYYCITTDETNYIQGVLSGLNADALPKTTEDRGGIEYTIYKAPAHGFTIGKMYRFRVQSYIENNGVKIATSDPLPVDGFDVRIGTKINSPQEVRAYSSSGSITVEWTPSDGAYKYIVRINKVLPNGQIDWNNSEYKEVRGATTYTHKVLNDGDSYVYNVTAVKNVEGHDISSEYPNGVVATAGSQTIYPADLTITPSGNDLLVTWQPIPEANGYFLDITYRRNGNTITETKDISAEKCQYLQKSPEYGVTYTYRVRSYRTIYYPDNRTPQKYESRSSYPEYYTIGGKVNTPTVVTAVPGEGQIVVSWQPVAGAEGYILYASGSNGSSDTFNVGNTTTFTHTGLVPGVTYSYTVVAYNNVNGTTVYSSASAPAKATVGGSIQAPIDFRVTSEDTSATLSWSTVKEAAGYTVYGRSATGKTLELNVSKSPYTHVGLETGDVWSYYVKAYKIVNNAMVYSNPTNTETVTIGSTLPAPTDFKVEPAESSAVLSWTTVKNATGYTVYGTSDTGKKFEIDVSKNTYIHTGLQSGENWTYNVRAYRIVNNQKLYSVPTTSITKKIGLITPAPMDLTAVSGNRQIELKWTAVKGDGYVVYQYDDGAASFLPIAIVSKPTYTHTGLKNGQRYTYMVAAYKNEGNERVIGDYSLAVSAIPTAGNAADVDSIINIKGTAPYGIPHSELIAAAANHEAFDDPVDAYISVTDASTRAVKQVLRNYANGLKSFIIYPFDIKTYVENSLVEVAPNNGYNITFTMPVPSQMVAYRDYITVIHLKGDGEDLLYDDTDDDIFVSSNEFEVLPSAIVQINGIWCVQFQTTSCSPFAFVIYRDNLDDISAGAGSSSAGGNSAGNFNTGLLLFTMLPDIMPQEKKTRYVVSTKKHYRIKK